MAGDGTEEISHEIKVTVQDIDLPPMWKTRIADFEIEEHASITGTFAEATDPDPKQPNRIFNRETRLLK